ncbi:Sulfate transporter/antisigma-factor antagonist STAS [[Leptolyngbya] sp. PCC 7376]|uniref:STAS domain-containing protein n=1 Tax=[Leptolyngbya] sp. PCC 7376 TaxID=111781 RepID=UPI00029EF75B|nr:STAS domain-containing protein [[Leptolyngbya] sp. PCC 7376]AFY36937.1 Sulfate transporter/antisigma-factor antagonist STAS [[Leptolyngbya] sp. PCC 7376]
MTSYQNLKTICPETPLTAANATEFSELLTTAIREDGFNKILINLKEVKLVDSAAVVALVKANRLAKSQGKEFGLCFANTQVRMILELTQLDRFVQVYEDEADFLGHRYELMAA